MEIACRSHLRRASGIPSPPPPPEGIRRLQGGAEESGPVMPSGQRPQHTLWGALRLG